MNELLKGFLVKDISVLTDLETILFEMTNIIEKRASVAYGELVKWQIERIVDEIAMNQYSRPENESILDIAAGEVRRRMVYSDKRMQCTEFNLSIGVQVLCGKYHKQPVIYLKILCPNDIYTKSLKKIPELIPLNIIEEDINDNKNNLKKELWDSLESKYQNDVPLVASLFNYDNLSINPEEFKFRSPEERADDLAKEKVLNQLLSSYACEQEISPNKLMEYILQSINRLNYKDIQNAMEMERQNLISFLPIIDYNLITKVGKDKELEG